MKSRKKYRKLIFYICVFAMLGTIMFCSKVIMQFLPNIHLLGMLTMVYTLVFRVRALIPIYVYVFLDGLYYGFNVWWMPYIYIWTVLWGITMLLPKDIPNKIGAIVYPVVCALHGLVFGILYAPAWAVLSGFDFEYTVLWVITGFPWDIVHMIGNFVAGLLIIPLYKLLSKLVRRSI